MRILCICPCYNLLQVQSIVDELPLLCKPHCLLYGIAARTGHLDFMAF